MKLAQLKRELEELRNEAKSLIENKATLEEIKNKRQKKKTYPKRYVLRLHLIKLSALFATLVASISGCYL